MKNSVIKEVIIAQFEKYLQLFIERPVVDKILFLVILKILN